MKITKTVYIRHINIIKTVYVRHIKIINQHWDEFIMHMKRWNHKNHMYYWDGNSSNFFQDISSTRGLHFLHFYS